MGQDNSQLFERRMSSSTDIISSATRQMGSFPQDSFSEAKSTVTTLMGELTSGDVSVRLHEHRWDVGATSDHHDERHVLVYRQSSTSEGLLLQAKGHSGAITCRLGQLALIPATVRLETFPPSHAGAAKTAMYHFPTSRVEDARLEDILAGNDLERSLLLENSKISHLMRYLAVETCDPGFGSEILLDAVAQALDLEIARYFVLDRQDKEISSRSGRLTPRNLDKIKSYINDNIGSDLSITNIALDCGLSKSHLNQCFKKTTGVSLHQYIINTRIDMAKRLLGRQGRPLSWIATYLGFRDGSAFSNAFYKKVGKRPSAFRQDALSNGL
jgi:AraC family transcriptional regulator